MEIYWPLRCHFPLLQVTVASHEMSRVRAAASRLRVVLSLGYASWFVVVCGGLSVSAVVVVVCGGRRGWNVNNMLRHSCMLVAPYPPTHAQARLPVMQRQHPPRPAFNS